MAAAYTHAAEYPCVPNALRELHLKLPWICIVAAVCCCESDVSHNPYMAHSCYTRRHSGQVSWLERNMINIWPTRVGSSETRQPTKLELYKRA